MQLRYLTFLFTFVFVYNACALTTTCSFEYYQRLIFIKIKVNNSDSLLFLFDTGANASAIDIKTADKLNLKTIKTDTVEGSAGYIVVPFVKTKTISFSKYKVKNLLLTKYDLSGSLAPPTKRLDGILGTDFLKHFVVSIDFQNKQMTLSKKTIDTLSASFPFEFDNGIPRIKATINNQVSTFFRYDSGSSLFDTKDIYLNSTLSIFELITKIDTTLKPVTHFSASGVGGDVDLPVYKVTSVSFDNFMLQNPFIIVQPKQGYFARPDAVGFFGNNLLDKFQKVTIDFIDKNVYVLNSKL